MKISAVSMAILLTVLSLASFAQEIPEGTILPVMLNSSLDAGRNHPGQAISAKIMQDVSLPNGKLIPRGSKVVGQIISASRATSTSGSSLTVSFDRITGNGWNVPIAAHVRALASTFEVFQAKLPTNSFADYGTSTSDWNTVQIGGAGVYRGNGEVVHDGEIVGRATDYGAVTAKLIAAPARGCANSSDREQALWVFSPWACGTYGFTGLKVAHTGETDPVGAIEFTSNSDIRIQGGSGWLLRVDSSGGKTVTTN
ncbi:MAG TPA: TrbI/VirB10 family protein [Terriglobales bacterium]|jgi:hypothetical protein|nr:TrbI/VirB10 family protein [Terriglobales bacterium]